MGSARRHAFCAHDENVARLFVSYWQGCHMFVSYRQGCHTFVCVLQVRMSFLYVSYKEWCHRFVCVLQALSGECGFMAANMYARSIFGEDVLANLSIEKALHMGKDAAVQGHVRIRAKSQVCWRRCNIVSWCLVLYPYVSWGGPQQLVPVASKDWLSCIKISSWARVTLFFLCMWHLFIGLAVLPQYGFTWWFGVKIQIYCAYKY